MTGGNGDSTGSAGYGCPLPRASFSAIRLGHGSGGKLTNQLIRDLFLPHLSGPTLSRLEDAAEVEFARERLAITTDSYVVSPIFFPGGDIGSLAVHGTINDLAMKGARPLYLTASFILEEGLSMDDLERVVKSLGSSAEECAIEVVACDTKVVNKGAADKMFINTAGIGVIEIEDPPASDRAREGDVIIVSGEIGLHGMAIMCAREGLELEAEIESDSAPLYELAAAIFDTGLEIHCLRDLTRGGLASALIELAESSKVGVELDEERIPVAERVKAACEILGLDPLYVACEGRLVAFVPENDAEEVLIAMQGNGNGGRAAIIGKVTAEHPGKVVLRSRIGGRRHVDRLSGDQLPRIC
ncbi:MAG TPA: hydrogenase expression/formation protein HypE [Candidatus Obscuribacterales bacterium]